MNGPTAPNATHRPPPRQGAAFVCGDVADANRPVAHLLYGSGLRLPEVLRLRIKDLHFSNRRILVRNGKGRTDRSTALPVRPREPLQRHIRKVKVQFEEDRANDMGGVYMPEALTEKSPIGPFEWLWQYVFPSTQLPEGPRRGVTRGHHRTDSAVQRAVKPAVEEAGIDRHAPCHTLRPSFPTHLLQDGADVRTIQEVLVHEDLRTTMKCVHVLEQSGEAVTSPLDTIHREKRPTTPALSLSPYAPPSPRSSGV